MVNEKITFVVQGAISHLGTGTEGVLKSIRKYYPGSIIILSTWKYSNVENYDYDYLILNEDPGVLGKDGSIVRNLNRQIVSSYTGIKLAKTRYVIKTRTDIEFFKTFDFSIYEKELEDGKYLITDITSVDPKSKYKYALHFCDWFILSRKESLVKLFDLCLYPEEFVNWYEENEKPIYDPNTYKPRFYAETYIWKNILEKSKGLKLNDGYVKNYLEHNRNVEFLKKYLLIISPFKIGFSSQKYSLPRPTFKYMYNEYECLALKNKIWLFVSKYKKIEYYFKALLCRVKNRLL